VILDYYYPDGRHRDDHRIARWRLQFLAEHGVGRLMADQEERLQGIEDERRRMLRGPG